MAFIEHGKTIKFDRSKNVEIHVRETTLLPGTDDAKQYIEIREFLQSSEMYGNGIIIPLELAGEAYLALGDLLARTRL